MNRSGMNAFKRCVLALACLLPAAAFAAAPDLAGIWQGKLVVDAKNSLTVQFTFTRGANGAYTAVLNSPDNPAIKDTPVSGVSWDGTNLKLQVPALSGGYSGALKAGRLSGQWTQPGSTLPLELAPWQKPVMTAATVKTLTGSWNGGLTIAGTTQNLVFQFKPAAAGGGLEGTFNIPDQGQVIPMSDIVLDNGELSMKIAQGRISFTGKLSGDAITGKLKIPSPVAPPDGVDLVMKRGDYKPPVYALKLSPEAFAQLKGKWDGKLEVTLPAPPAGQGGGQPPAQGAGQAAGAAGGQKLTFLLSVRFETNAKSEYVGYLDGTIVGQQGGAKNIGVSEAAVAGGNVSFKVAAQNAAFDGMLSGNTLTGKWTQPGGAAAQGLPLTLTRTP